jgi:hypothetical protein
VSPAGAPDSKIYRATPEHFPDQRLGMGFRHPRRPGLCRHNHQAPITSHSLQILSVTLRISVTGHMAVRLWDAFFVGPHGYPGPPALLLCAAPLNQLDRRKALNHKQLGELVSAPLNATDTADRKPPEGGLPDVAAQSVCSTKVGLSWPPTLAPRPSAGAVSLSYTRGDRVSSWRA